MSIDIKISTIKDCQNVQLVVQIVNEGYERGEIGMWKANTGRTNEKEMLIFLSSSKILLARDNDIIVGCIFVDKSFGDQLGELGMLSVSKSHLGKGLGVMLINAAESFCKSNGCLQMRLEVLTPKNYVHETKDWLGKWYERLGYVKGSPEDFAIHYAHIAPFLLCECIFYVYIKDI